MRAIRPKFGVKLNNSIHPDWITFSLQSQTKLEVLTVHWLMADISVLLLTCQFWADRWFMVSGYITTNDQYLWRLCLSFGFHRKDELLIKIKCTSKIDIFHKISFVSFSLH